MHDNSYQSMFFILEQSWLRYQQYLKKVRESPSTKRIHKLRVATRKLQAALELSRVLLLASGAKCMAKDPIKLLNMSLQKVAKKCGSLRNFQIERSLLKGRGDLKLGPLNQFISTREKGARKKVRRILDGELFKNQNSWFEEIKEGILGRGVDINSSQASKLLAKKVKSSYMSFEKARHSVLEGHSDSIHQLRILAKKLRYQEEVLRAITGHSNIDLSHLRRVQEVIGHIQDRNMILKTTHEFLSTKPAKQKKSVKTYENRLKGERERFSKMAVKVMASMKSVSG